MSKDRTDKSKYLSRYAPETYVSQAQYIVEYICEKKARQNGKDLPIRFWKLPEWAAYFRSQINTAHALLKKYEEKAIIKALQHPKAFRIYSLRAPHLIPLIEEENKKVLLEKQSVPTIIPQIDTSEKPRERKDKLRELDG